MEGYVFAGCFDCLLHFAVLCARLYESDLSSSFVKEISVVVEKEVPVIVCHESQLHIYRLEDGLRFDADLDMLKNGDLCLKLTPLSAKLLRGFWMPKTSNCLMMKF